MPCSDPADKAADTDVETVATDWWTREGRGGGGIEVKLLSEEGWDEL